MYCIISVLSICVCHLELKYYCIVVYCIVLKPPLIVFCRGVTRAVAAADRSRSTSPDGLHSAAKSVRPHACMRAH